MTTIVTRAGKGSPLTHTEVDTNFTNLNTAKLEAGAIALGSAAAPSISFVSDTNTGIFSPGADQVAISCNGTERLRIDSSGNVGIGTSAPGGKLDVRDAGTTIPALGAVGTGLNVRRTDGAIGLIIGYENTIGGSYIQAQHTNGSAVAYPLYLQPNGGNVGIGTTAPSQTLEVVGDARITNSAGSTLILNRTGNPGSVALAHSGTETGQIQAVSGGGINFFVGSSPSLKATIDSSGRLLVGTTNDAGSASNRIVVGSNGICGVKKTFTNLDTTPQSFAFQASNASVYVAHLQSVSTASVAFLIACVYDPGVGIIMATTALGRCTAGGDAATISGIYSDARTYTFQRDGGTGELTVAASAVATGSTIIALTPLNQFL